MSSVIGEYMQIIANEITVMSYCNKYICSIFDGNLAMDGSAMNVAYLDTKLYNVTFKSNKGSALRVSCI